MRITRASVAKAATATAALTSTGKLSARSSSSSSIVASATQVPTATFLAAPSRRKSKRERMSNTTKPRGTLKVSGSETNTNDTASVSRTSTHESIRELVHSKIQEAASTSEVELRENIETKVLGGWCLVEALTHCAVASNRILEPLILKYGPPKIYTDYLVESNRITRKKPRQTKDEFRSFRSLCRIVSGQQLAGAAAVTRWKRLLGVVGATEEDPLSLTPETILALAVSEENIESNLRQPAGLSRAKCNCILAVAEKFRDGDLSDELLLKNDGDDQYLRTLLLAIKGLGPWSVDMFLLFQCQRSNILPVGDLAVRNGTSFLWKVKGNAKGGLLCPKKDLKTIENLHEPFQPYRSISSHYMYRAIEEQRSSSK